MGWQRLTCACALALVGCGDNQGTTTQSGSRLRLSWIDFGGGVRLLSPLDLWDDERHEPCYARRWTDGNTYCTPTGAAAYPYYTSSDCSSASYYVESAERPSYIVHFVDVVGQDEASIGLLAKPEPATLDQYWVKDDEGCHGPNNGVGRDWYEAGEEVPRADLVRIRTRESAGDGRVAVRASVTDDGMYAPLAFEDRQLHAECFMRAPSEDESWCAPDGGSVQYHDAGCTESVLAYYDRESSPSKGIQVSTCDPRVYAVGGEIFEPPAFERVDGTCQPSTDVGVRWFALVEHPVATLARARETTGARLEQVTMNVDGTTVPAQQLFDTETGEMCVRATSASGDYRCIPRNVGFVADMFGDMSCTIPVKVGFVLTRNPVMCNGPMPRYARAFSAPQLVYELLGPRPNPAYWRDGTSCMPDASTSYQIYDLGLPISDDTWARGALVHD
jgi:hypothetical protein